MTDRQDTLFALLRPGERVVFIKDNYGGTNRIFTGFLPNYGIEVCLGGHLNGATRG